MKKYGVGVWGAGLASRDHVTGYLAQFDCEIVAIGSLQLTDAQALAHQFGLSCDCYTDYQTFLAHPGLDVVSICTPNHLHTANTIAAAVAHKHIFVEKPIALTLADLYTMREVLRENRVQAVTGFVVRWIPLVIRMRQLIREGALGAVRVIDVDYWHSRRRPIEFRTRAMGGSAMLLGGCHALDTAIFLTGAAPIEVIARSTHIGSNPDEYEFDAAEMCLIRYSNGAVGRISAVVNGHFPYQFNIDLLGDQGIIRNNQVFLAEDIEERGFQTLAESGPEKAKANGLPYAALIRHFLDCVESGIEPDVSIEHAIRVHEVCFAAMLSERTGKPVRLPLDEDDQVAIQNLM